MLVKRSIFLALTATTSSAFAAQDRPIEALSDVASGGGKGPVVKVRTTDQLEHELCHSKDASGQCIDSAPRVVEVIGTIDFRGSMGATSAQGCSYDPKAPTKILLTTADPEHTCMGAGLIKRTFTLDAAGLRPLLLGSNKTLIGVGPSAVIQGRGLKLKKVSNVVIKNLTIRDINPSFIWGGDAVDLDDVDKVWIDHNRFALVGRQMIVGHFGPIANINITWNEFEGKTPFDPHGHYYNMLFNSNQVSDVTIAYNWFHDFSGRSPALHMSGTFDIVNNYFERSNGHAVEVYEGATAIMEGNVFSDVSQPIARSTGQIFAPLESDGQSIRAACKPLLNRPCIVNVVLNARETSGFHADAADLAGIKRLPSMELYPPSKLTTAVKSSAGPL